MTTKAEPGLCEQYPQLGSIFERTQCFESKEGWLPARNTPDVVGASDAWGIIESPLESYQRKVVPDPPFETDAMWFGKVMEGPLHKYLEFNDFALLDLGDYAITQGKSPYSWMQATTDRIVLSAPPATLHDFYGGIGVAEFKTHTPWLKHDWDAGLPLSWQVQVQHQLAVTDLHWGVVCWWERGSDLPKWEFLYRNQRLIDGIIFAEEKFLERVANQDPPPLSDPDSDAAAIAKLFPKHIEGKAIDLADGSADLFEAWQTMSSREKETAAAAKGLRNELALRMGDAEVGRLGNGIELTYKEQTVKGHVAAESSFRVLRHRKEKTT